MVAIRWAHKDLRHLEDSTIQRASMEIRNVLGGIQSQVTQQVVREVIAEGRDQLNQQGIREDNGQREDPTEEAWPVLRRVTRPKYRQSRSGLIPRIRPGVSPDLSGIPEKMCLVQEGRQTRGPVDGRPVVVVAVGGEPQHDLKRTIIEESLALGFQPEEDGKEYQPQRVTGVILGEDEVGMKAFIAHMCHLLLNKTPSSTQTSHVILSFGLNNKMQSNPILLGKLVKRLVVIASATFPFAKIWIPVINCKEGIPH